MQTTDNTLMIAQWRSELLGRHAGEELRGLLRASVAELEAVTLDFDGVDSISQSFSDECFGILMAEFASQAKPPHVRFVNLREDLRPIVRAGIANRRQLQPL